MHMYKKKQITVYIIGKHAHFLNNLTAEDNIRNLLTYVSFRCLVLFYETTLDFIIFSAANVKDTNIYILNNTSRNTKVVIPLR
jgi:hypothetical protein